MGLSLGRQLSADDAGRVLGRGGRALDRRGGSEGGSSGRRGHRTRRRAGVAPQSAGDGVRQARRRFRYVEDAVGRRQSLPAPDGRHRSALQRCRAQHPGRLHVVAVGVARLVRRPPGARDEEVVRDDGEQFRGGRGVRSAGPREGRDSRRAERRSRVTAFRRPGRALRDRRPPGGGLLSQPVGRAHRTAVSAGEVEDRALWFPR